MNQLIALLMKLALRRGLQRGGGAGDDLLEGLGRVSMSK